MPSKTREIWADVKGYKGYYQVSNKGRVKSLTRRIRVKTRWGTFTIRRCRGRVLKPIPASSRMVVGLYKDKEGEMFGVHVLVLNAFVGPCPKGMEGCHEDGNWRNNEVGNLRWDTHKGNHQDRIRHGTNNRGEKSGLTHLTEEDVIEIRTLYATGKYLMKEIGKMFDLTENGVSNIVHGRAWKYVEFLPKSDFGRGYSRLKKMGRKW